MVCTILSLSFLVGVGIAYAAMDEERTSIIIQSIATGEAVLLAVIFAIIFYQSIFWFNKIHEIENSEKMAKKRRTLHPLGTKVEVKGARRVHPSDAATVGTQSGSMSEHPMDDTDTVLMMIKDDDTDNNEDTVYLLDHVGGDMIKPMSSDHLQPLSPSMTVILLLSALFTLLGLMACE